MAGSGISLQISSLYRLLPVSLLFRSVTGLVIVLLMLVMLLGTRQYMMSKLCGQAVAVSDQLLFNYTTIKDHISEALLSGQTIEAGTLGGELRGLSETVQWLSEDGNLPRSIKTTLVSRRDFIDLTVQLRGAHNSDGFSQQEVVALTRTLNGINVSLQQFRLALGDHTRSLLVGLQKMIIGALALTVVVVCWALLAVNRHIATPILNLGKLIGDDSSSDNYSLEELVGHFTDRAAQQGRLGNLLSMLTRASDAMHRAEPIEKYWLSICKVLAGNPDFSLVWVGSAVEQPDRIKFICSCGELGGVIKENREICPADSSRGSSFCTTALRALAQRQPVSATLVDNFSSNTGLDGAKPRRSASFPLDTGFGPVIITLVSPLQECFSEPEMELVSLGLQQVLRMGGLENAADKASADRRLEVEIVAGYCAACGYLLAVTSGAIINRINGVINYSQALIDSMAADALATSHAELYDGLQKGARETTTLAKDLLHLCQAMENSTEHSPLQLILQSLQNVLAVPMKADGINLQIHCPHSAAAGIPDREWWLLLLALCRIGRASLQSPAGDRYPQKELIFSSELHSQSQRLSLGITNSSGQWRETSQDQANPWQSLSFCRCLVQSHHGEFTEVQKNDRTTVLRIELPLHTMTS